MMARWGGWGAWALLLALAFVVDRWVYLNVSGAVAETTGFKAWRFDRPEGGRAPKIDEVLTLFKRLGELWFLLVVAGTMLFLAPQRRGQVLVLCVAAALTALFGQGVLKHAVGKLRPDAALSAADLGQAGDLRIVVREGKTLNQGAALFRPFSLEHSGLTFPSGHAALAFAVAVVLGACFPRGRRWFLFLASCVAASRVLMGEHFLSDVIAGAGVGYACARAVLAMPRMRRLMVT